MIKPNHRQFLKDLGEYISGLSDSDDIGSVDHFPAEELFVDQIASKYKLRDECEASLSVSLSFIRMAAILVKEKEKNNE